MTRVGAAVRKVKRCHGDWIEPQVLLADASSQRMLLRLDSVPYEHFRTEWLEDVEEIAERVLAPFREGGVLESEESSRLLQQWLQEIERRLAALAQCDSRQFALHLVRRIKPSAEPYGVDLTTAALARTTLDLAIQKYARAEGRRFVLVAPDSPDLRTWITGADEATLVQSDSGGPRGLLPTQLTYADAVWAYRMEALAYSFAHVAAQLRRAWKGGRLVVAGSASGVDLDAGTEELVQLFDRRARRYNGALSGFGLIADIGDLGAVRARPDWAVFLPIPNWERIDTAKMAGLRTTFAYQSNYIVMPATLEPWYEGASLFNDEIRRASGADARDIALTLCAASQRHVAFLKLKPEHAPSLWDRGYLVINDLAEFVSDLGRYVGALHSRLFGTAISAAEGLAMATRGVEALSLPEERFGAIDVWARTGARPIFALGGQWLLNYTLIPLALSDLLESLTIPGGDAGRRKGDAFERQAESIVRAELPAVRVWNAQGELEFPDGTRRELDRGFVYERRLYVAECKSLLVPPAHDRGDQAALMKRRTEIAGAISAAETLAAKLARFPAGRNYKLPDDVLELVPCALSPFTEYMPARTARFFLDAAYQWPRVMVPREFADALKATGDGKFSFSELPLRREA